LPNSAKFSQSKIDKNSAQNGAVWDSAQNQPLGAQSRASQSAAQNQNRTNVSQNSAQNQSGTIASQNAAQNRDDVAAKHQARDAAAKSHQTSDGAALYHDFLRAHGWMFSTSANAHGQAFDEDFARAHADAVIGSNFIQKAASVIIRLTRDKARKLR